jgi:endoglucanase
MNWISRMFFIVFILILHLEPSNAGANFRNRHVGITSASTTASNSCAGITNETGYTLVIGSADGNGPYCTDACDATEGSYCYTTLSQGDPNNPGGSQAVTIPPESYLYQNYSVCVSVSYDDTGYPVCGGYSGSLGVTYSQYSSNTSVLISSSDGGTATMGTPVNGYYPLYFTSDSTPCPVGTAIPTPQTYSSIPYRGVNMAGCDFATFYPPYACNAIYFVQQGASTIRLPVLWEYLQPGLIPTSEPAPIDFTSGNALTYSELVTELTNAGLFVIIDMHNYMRYNAAAPGETITGPNYIIGSGDSTALTKDQYVAAWESIAQQFVNNPLVMFDLMNEPNDMSTYLIIQNYNAVIAAIRSVETAAAVSPHLIHLEGNSYTCMATWTTSDPSSGYDVANSVVFVPGTDPTSTIVDPSDNYVIHVHEYFTGNGASPPTGSCGSGEEDECIDADSVLTTENFSAFTDYLAANGLKAFIGELNGAPNSNCAACVDNLLTGVDSYPYSEGAGYGFLGWTGWAGGSFGSTYRLNLSPTYSGTTPTQTIQMLEGFNPHMTPID